VRLYGLKNILVADVSKINGFAHRLQKLWPSILSTFCPWEILCVFSPMEFLFDPLGTFLDVQLSYNLQTAAQCRNVYRPGSGCDSGLNEGSCPKRGTQTAHFLWDNREILEAI
jgi:hypothetical protein